MVDYWWYHECGQSGGMDWRWANMVEGAGLLLILLLSYYSSSPIDMADKSHSLILIKRLN